MAIGDDRKSKHDTRNRFQRLGGEQGDMWLFVAALAIALVIGVIMISTMTRDTATDASAPLNTSSPSTNTTSNPQRAPKQP